MTKDLAFDLETGHLALILVKLEGLDETMQGYLAVPPAALEAAEKGLQFRNNVKNARLATARRLPESAYHRQLNRGWAEQQYKLFEKQAYWVRPIKVQGQKLPLKSGDRESKDKDYMLTLASNLKNIQVNGQDGQAIGLIKGLALAPQEGQLVYAAMQLKEEGNDKLYPVPLGAFVVDAAKQPWTIELDRDVVANTPSFAPDDWPSKVERGWIEYVHVRYGRAAIGGVQHKNASK